MKTNPMSLEPAAQFTKPIEPHMFKAANAPITSSLTVCKICGLSERLCLLTYRPRHD